MNPSRTFILRPVATSLLMVGILLVGAVAFQSTACFGAAGSRLSDHPGHHVLSRREPGRDGVVGYRAAGAPVRAGARTSADDLHQLRWKLGHHARVQPESNIDIAEQEVQQSINASGTYLPADLPTPPIYAR